MSAYINFHLLLALNVFSSVVFGQINDNQSQADISLNEMGTANLDKTTLTRFANSSNNDGIAEFKINFGFTDEITILAYPNNFLQVFNRWGTRVFHKKGYIHDWDGRSTGLATMGAIRKIPIGTYFYVLTLGNGTRNQKTGWLYITEQKR